MCWHFVNLAVTRNLAVWLRVCGGILEFTASLRSRGQGCSVPALPGDEDEDGVVNGESLVGGGGTFQQKYPFVDSHLTEPSVHARSCQLFLGIRFWRRHFIFVFFSSTHVYAGFCVLRASWRQA